MRLILQWSSPSLFTTESTCPAVIISFGLLKRVVRGKEIRPNRNALIFAEGNESVAEISTHVSRCAN
jgi:hypothetical protein